MTTCVSSPGRKLSINANGSFGPEFLGKHGEFNYLVTLSPQEILHLQSNLSCYICAVPLHGKEVCRQSLKCSSHSMAEKLEVERPRCLFELIDEERVDPQKVNHQRNMVRLYLDYRRFWSSSWDNGSASERTCSRESCGSVSSKKSPPRKKPLKLAYVDRISKKSATKIPDFVACLHHRLRCFSDEAGRLQEVRQRLVHVYNEKKIP
ncbi:hypothetical protein FT663_03925 [Candidozyma haemuli var. vulneris]|uniref:SCA7 domain-containing protein n=1 Tax=Candidozyma haemuli TaxID=45357 RepID=A0A2V1ASK8_9ASCO|nr:hypothetical protein CXQ85_004347 [[Candida] haemuloni]KAF3988693.1 hypothetical protein FT663_03925 [[Candida] haemuloni var. vulneris]KAF3990452.1 hypothetical protein FT662_02249 [[Candida] haemuloni var. vulneris]PVH20839.1 hypothetical protein CXQ85_004347 [[Candida] haemuloni]